jgi:hypothetical protein
MQVFGGARQIDDGLEMELSTARRCDGLSLAGAKVKPIA